MIVRCTALLVMLMFIVASPCYALDTSVGATAVNSNVLKTLKSKVEDLGTSVSTNAISLTTVYQDINASETKLTNAKTTLSTVENCALQGLIYDKSTKACAKSNADIAKMFTDLGCTTDQIIGLDGTGKAICQSMTSTCPCTSKTKYVKVYKGTQAQYPPPEVTLSFVTPNTTACSQAYNAAQQHQYISWAFWGPGAGKYWNTAITSFHAICTPKGWMETYTIRNNVISYVKLQ